MDRTVIFRGAARIGGSSHDAAVFSHPMATMQVDGDGVSIRVSLLMFKREVRLGYGDIRKIGLVAGRFTRGVRIEHGSAAEYAYLIFYHPAAERIVRMLQRMQDSRIATMRR